MYRPAPAFAPFLYMPGMIYRAGVFVRNRAFDAGFISARDLPHPAVSVGNITLGGTGKTPFVIYLAELIREIGYKTAVLTRGYGRSNSGETIIMPPGENADFPAFRIGDEPALIRRKQPEAWLGISQDRFFAANAIARHETLSGSDRLVFILDDGFQRRNVRRDLDIVMIDSMRNLHAEKLFPSGSLREPATELRRAHVVIMNGTGSSGDAEPRTEGGGTITENLRKYAPKAEFFHCSQRIQTILPFSAWLDYSTPDHLSVPIKTAFLAAAIGNPYRFKLDIQSLGIEMRGCAFYRDHYVIDKKDLENCAKTAREEKADAIIITEKDAVKISSPPDFPLLVAIQVTELQETGRFREILQRCIRR